MKEKLQFMVQPYVVLYGNDKADSLERELNDYAERGYRLAFVVPGTESTDHGTDFDQVKLILYREPMPSEIIGSLEWTEAEIAREMKTMEPMTAKEYYTIPSTSAPFKADWENAEIKALFQKGCFGHDLADPKLAILTTRGRAALRKYEYAMGM